MKKLSQLALAFVFALGLAIPAQSQTQNWVSDPVHSTVQFSVRHILTPFIGKFDTYQVDVVFDENDLGSSSIKASLDPASVNSYSEGRDKHLTGNEFFDVAEYPEHWAFESTSIEKVGEGEFLAKGKMTVKGKTVEMDIPFKFLGTMDTRFGLKSGITAEFSLLRSEWNLGGEVGGMVGDEVKMVAALELNAVVSDEE